MEKGLFQNAMSLDELYNDYHKLMENLEKERYTIHKRMQKLEQKKELCRDFQRDVYQYVRTVENADHDFKRIRALQDFETVIQEHSMQRMKAIEDEKEELDIVKKKNYFNEEEIEQQFRYHRDKF